MGISYRVRCNIFYFLFLQPPRNFINYYVILVIILPFRSLFLCYSNFFIISKIIVVSLTRIPIYIYNAASFFI